MVPRQSRSSHPIDFTRELEAMIKFSQRKISLHTRHRQAITNGLSMRDNL
jgi:hypothetical protein